jgi:hypothetical protein
MYDFIAAFKPDVRQFKTLHQSVFQTQINYFQTLSYLGPSTHLLLSLLLRNYQPDPLLFHKILFCLPQILLPLPAVFLQDN